MKQDRHLPAFFISLICTVLLVCAFVLPVLHSSLDISLPDWAGWLSRFLPGSVEDSLRDWAMSITGIPLGDQYVFGIIRDLWRNNEIFLSVLIFGFSAIFPLLKLSLSLVLSSGMSMTHARRRKLQHFLELTSKWSMADVFIVAMVVVFFKADGFQFQFVPQAGIYCFAVAAVGSSVAVHMLKVQLTQASESVGESVGAIAGQLRQRGDEESAKMAEELDTIRGQIEKAHYEV
jgi:hypothetical protein